jgi:hypothetical protein
MPTQNQYSSLRHLALSIPSFWKDHPRLMGMYTGYFDESNDEELPDFVMGGLVIDAERVEQFDKDWLAAIAELPRVDGKPQLHTTDFVSGNQIYDPEWKGRYPEKLAILSCAASVIEKYACQVFTCALDMEDYIYIDSNAKFSEAAGHPYALAVRIAYQQMVLWSQHNASSCPIKMIVEERKGFGEVSDLFIRDKVPVPSQESKAVCALQAADYIAWMKSKKIKPTKPYLAVQDSWRKINRTLYTDQSFDLNDYSTMWRNLCIESNLPLPFREDEKGLIIFNGNKKNPRKQFRRKAKPRPV